MTPSCALDTTGNPPTRPTPACPPTRAAACSPTSCCWRAPRHGRLRQARLPGGHARPDRRDDLFRHDAQRVRRRFQAHEDYEPGIPGVTVLLETPGPDGVADTNDDVVVNEYVTDAWQQPNAAQDPQADGNSFTQSCAPIKDFQGNDVTNQFAAKISPNCLEVPLTGQQTKDGAFDGGYAFTDYCPAATTSGPRLRQRRRPGAAGGGQLHHPRGDAEGHPRQPCVQRRLADGNLEVSQPHGSVPGGGSGCIYRIVREDDVNVDLGNHFTPQIPPPPCVGDESTIDQQTLTPRSNYYTGDQATSTHRPLCDKHLIELQNGQNANADFYMMTNFRNDPNGQVDADTHAGDVQEPGRLVGQVFNDIYFETNQDSPWYGEPRPIGGIPVGIYARVDTKPNVNLPYDENNWRLLTTVNHQPGRLLRGPRPVHRDAQLPDPAGAVPGHVPGQGRRRRQSGAPEPQLRPQPAGGDHSGRGVAGPDHPARPAAGPDLGHRLRLLRRSRRGRHERPRAAPGLASRPHRHDGAGTAAREVTLSADFIGSAGGSGVGGGHADRLPDGHRDDADPRQRWHPGLDPGQLLHAHHPGHDRRSRSGCRS